MLKRQGRRFRVVVVGDTYQGPKRGILYVPGQPRIGLVRTEALALAATWTEQQVLSFAGQKVGSHVRPHVRAALVEIGSEEIQGGTRFERPTPSEPTIRKYAETETQNTVPPAIRVLSNVEKAGELVMQRRLALKAISEIDAELSELIDTRSVEVIQRGMAMPLSALN
jgi:hypothetical protein